MKHNLKLTAIILTMFIVTQLIGLAVVSHYSSEDNSLPFGMDSPEVDQENAFGFLASLIIAFVIAIFLVFILMNIKSVWVMRAWFFLVIVLALGITFNAIGTKLNIPYPTLIALFIAIVLAYFKIFQRNIIVHNLTELFVYPGIAAVFVPILNIWTVIIFLIALSIYDLWAVWHSGFMMKMAKFQINKLRIFGGFFIPYAGKKVKQKIKNLKLKYKGKEIPESAIKKNKIKVNIAILGGGDVIFPIIAAGVFLKTFQSLWATLIVTLGATLALVYLSVFGKKKPYPAMPFLTAGIFAGMILGWLLTILI